MKTVAPTVGETYLCKNTPSGFIFVTAVAEHFVSGWGDAYGGVASHRVVVPLARLRNTRRQGPFRGISEKRTVDTA